MATSTRRKPGSVRKRGYLFKLPVSGGVLKVWAKRWAVLHSTNHEGVVRLEYYDNSEAEPKGENKRVILLRNCTGCIETSEFKSKPYAFQFSTQQGRHVFCTESQPDMESWIEEVNDVIKEDRMKAKKTMKKNSMAEIITREPVDPSSGHAPHVGTLMGVYNVSLSPTDLSKALNLSGTYSLDVTPKGMSLISNVTNTEITKWHFRHIKFYSKSSSNVVSVQLGRRSPTGEGKFLFQTTVAKELFSMIHRNIKKIKMAQDKKLKEEMEKEAERIREIRRRRAEEQQQSQQVQMRTLPPKSSSFDDSHQRQRMSYQRSSTIDPFTSASTIGTVADDDLIQLEGLADFPDFNDDFVNEMETFDKKLQNQSDRNRLSMGAMLDEKLELDGLKQLTPAVYQDVSSARQQYMMNQPPIEDVYDEIPKEGVMNSSISTNKQAAGGPWPGGRPSSDPIYDQPPRERFGNSFVPSSGPQQGQEPIYDQPPPASTNPFMEITDPFSISGRGSFYNAEEDIFQSFDQVSSNKTSTPNNFKGGPPNGGHTSLTPFAPPQHHSTMNTSIGSGGSISNEAYSNVEVLRGLKDIQLDTNQKGNPRPPVALPRTMKRGASKKELDDMWGDIAKGLTL